ncbi:MAG: N-acetylmuramoyl-L-alanine amidase [Terriglobales bacterium]
MKTQASTTLTRGGLAFRLGAAWLFVLLPLLPASARIHRSDTWARQQFVKAERMREALNGRPAAQRNRREYQRVIDSYRSVYLGSPKSPKADPSVVATAELMVEMGRRFDDSKVLRGAIDQYHFLRKEYPGSKYRFDALFTIGEIYKDDLDDPADARTTFEDFLRRYPHNRLAADARAAVKEIDLAVAQREPSAPKPGRTTRASSTNTRTRSAPAVASTEASPNSDAPAISTIDADRSGLPRVTGVRHWSTPDYTRVAIDVEQEIKFDSERISHPDRIFFDLRDTRLASTLVGKTFDVDDGFLKKIRVAESQPGRTRIVLEVDDLASYDAFLLPDPYRLIIDIHGKNNPSNPSRMTASKALPSETADDTSQAASTPPISIRARKASHGSGPVETDLPPDSASADSNRSNSAKSSNGGIVKTTVAVKGSNHTIPKTIVQPDGDGDDGSPATSASVGHQKLHAENTAGNDDTSPSKSETSSPAARRKKPRSAAAAPAEDSDLHSDRSLEAREARPTAAGERSLTRALGLKIGKIVIDAGHGGHDTGTIGPNGLQEKDLVLDVAKRLGRLLEARLGAEVVYTRKDDTFIPLETRTAIANRERADLFISIHANSSHDADARGVETYYLNFTSSPEALEVAARENAVSEKSIHELQDLVKKIALKEKIEESREFAGDVQESLYGGLSLENAGIRDRGIKKAPFIVLIGANMPSILAEISFVSNPTDERKLETSEHRQRIAESLYRGVSKYVNGLSGVKVASKIDKPQGQ